MDKQLFSIQEAALYIGVSSDTLRRWETKGFLIPQRTLGNQRRYSRQQLDTYKSPRKFSLVDEAKSITPEAIDIVDSESLRDEPPSPNLISPIGEDLSPKQGIFYHSELSLPPADPVPMKKPGTPFSSRLVVAGLLLFLGLTVGAVAIIPIVIGGTSGRGSGGLLAKLPFLAAQSHTNINTLRARTLSVTSEVLGVQTKKANYALTISVPTFFKAPADFKQLVQLHNGLQTNNTDINAGTGSLIAGNVIYKVTAGKGIAVSAGQSPTITNTGVISLGGLTGAVALTAGDGISVSGTKISATNSFVNTDKGSTQNIFKTIAVSGQDPIVASQNSDTLTFAAGSNIILTTDANTKKVLITASSSLGGPWVTTGSNIYYNSGNVGVGTSTPSSLFDVSGVFKVNGSGVITAGTWNGATVSTQYGGTGQNFSAIAQGSLPYFSGTGTLAALSPSGAAGRVLESQGDNANPIWVDITSALSNFWSEANGALSPIHPSVDFLVGSSSTASAKFGLINVGSGTPTATISGSTGATYLTADGKLATTNNQTLTLGGNTTGNIILTPGSGAGYVTINGTANLSGSNAYQINGVNVLSTSNLGTSVVNSSLTKVGILTNGSIASGFGSILTTQSITGSDFTATGSVGGLTFTGAGSHIISATSGTLTINPFTLGGVVTGNNQSIIGLGNVGIGTTSPLTALDVTGSASLSGSISFRTNATHNINLLDNSSFGIQRSLNGDGGLVTAFTVDKGGNVGIGTTNPTSLFAIAPAGTTKFSVDSTGTIGFNGGSSFTQALTSNAAAAKTYNLPDFVGSSADVCLTTGNCSGVGGGLTGAGTTNYVAKFSSSSTLTTGTIYDNGNIGLGTSSPTAKLDVNGTASISGQLTLYGAPQIQSTTSQTLTLGGNTTGNIVLTPLNGLGTVTVSGIGTGPVHSTSGVLSSGSINLASEVSGILPVANGGTGAATLGANGLLYGNGTSAVGVTTAGANGQLLLGVTSGAPIFAPLSGDATITNSGVITLKNTGPGAGSLGTTASQTPIITVDAQGRIVSVSNTSIAIAASQITSGILPIANGGTNNSSAYTLGSVVFSDGLKLTQDNSNFFYNGTTHVLGLGTTSPTAKLDVNGTASISGQLALYGTPQIQSTANQNLTIGGNTTGDIILTPRSGAGTVKITGYGAGILHTNASGSISPSPVVLTTDVSGVLPSANGGTGLNSIGGPDQLFGTNNAGNALEYKDLSSLIVAGTGIGLSGTTTVTINNTGVTSLIGTTSQVNISGATGAVTLSLPQSIATTSTVRFGKLGLGIAPITNLHIDGSTAGKALAILNYTGTDQDIFTASASGTTQFVIGGTGNIGFAGNSGFIQTLTSNAAASKIYNLPNFSGPSVDICLNTGNCSGAGSGITGSGTVNYITKFSASQNIVSSNLYSDGAGNLGIGTTTPTGLFHLTGTNAGKALAILNDTGTNQNLLTASQSGVTKFNVTSTGDIGFAGNSSFVNTLTTTAVAARTYVLPDPGQATANICLSTGNCAGSGGVVAGTGTTNYIPLWTSSTGISSSALYQTGGNIGLGTTTPTATFDVNGTASISGKLALYGTPQIESTAEQVLTIGGATTGDIRFIPQGTSSLTLSGGNIQAFGTITGLTGLSSSGTITFSSIPDGVARITSGVLSTGAVNLGLNSDVTNTLNVSHGGTGVANLAVGGMLYGSGGTTLSKLLIGTPGQVLTVSGGIPTWVDPGTLSTSYWTLVNGTLRPNNPTVDLLVGGSSSASAKFAFLNVDSGSPTASISGNLSLVVPTTSNSPADTLNILNKGSFNIQRSIGGDAGLASSLYINSSGNVGIGTTAPDSLLALSSSAPVLTFADTQFGGRTYQLRNGATGAGGFDLYDSSAASTRLFVASNGEFRVGSATNYGGVGNASRMFVYGGTNGANIDVMGCSTTAADCASNYDQSTIELEGSTYASTPKSVYLQYSGASAIGTSMGGFSNQNLGRLVFNNASTALIYTSGNAIPLIFGTNDVERFRINGNGNVGIGTTAPSSLLSVGSTSQFQVNSTGAIAAATGVSSSGTIAFSALSTNGLVKTTGGTGTIAIATPGTDYENPLTFNNGLTRTTNTVALGGTLTGGTTIANGGFNLSITGAGNVGIGTSSPGEKLDITGNLGLSGLVTSGTWNGTAISSTYGGTGIDTHLSSGVPTISTGTWSVQPQLSTLLGGTGQNFSAIAQGSLPYFSATGAMAALAPGTTGYILTTNGTGLNPSWQDPAVLSGGTNLWQQQNGTLSPKNSTVDLLIGGTSSTSAKFAFLNVNSGSPTASISGNLSLVVPTTVNSPASTLNILNNGSFNIQRSLGGDIGLTSSLFINSAGNVGIGTTNPSSALHVDVTQAGTYASQIKNESTTGNGLYLFTDNNDTHPVLTTQGWNGSAVTLGLDVLSNGNVGIGTTTPAASLETTGDIQTPIGGKIGSRLASTGSNGYIVPYDSIGNTLIWNTYTNGYGIEFGTNNILRMLIDGQGNVGIGTGLNLSDFTTTINTTGNGKGILGLTGDGQQSLLTASVSGVTKFQISNTGNVGIGNAAPTALLEITGCGGGCGQAGRNLLTVTGATPGLGLSVGGSTGAISLTTGAAGSCSNLGCSGGNAGGISLTTGNGGAGNGTGGAGGNITFTAGNGATNNGAAGFIKLIPGTASGTGTAGYISLAPTGGNVGIGTTSTTARLDVAGGTTSIATSNNVIGIQYGVTQNTAPSANQALGMYGINAGPTYSASSNVALASGASVGLYGAQITTNQTSGQVSSNFGIYAAPGANVATILGQNVTQNLWGVYSLPNTTSTGNVGDLRALYGNAYHAGTGTVSVAIGAAGIVSNVSTGTISDARGLYAGFNNAGGGTVTSTYGVYIDNMVGGTQTNAAFALYSPYNVKSYHVGKLGLNTINPTNQLGVTGAIAATGAITANCACAPDIAEMIPTSDLTIGAADVVSVDPNNPDSIVKSQSPYERRVLGVISTDPRVLLGGSLKNVSSDYADTDNGHKRPIVIGGQVPVKVSAENGPIVKGDYLTSSTIPGVAMKATKSGMSVARALDDYNGAGVGQILSYVGSTWYDPDVYLTSTGDVSVIAAAQGTQQLYELQKIAGAKVDRNAEFNQAAIADLKAGSIDTKSITVGGKSLAQFIADTVGTASGSAAVNSLYASESAVFGLQTQVNTHASQISSLTTQVSQLTDLVQTLASGSAAMNASGSAQFASVEALNIKDATISGTLNVLGRTTLGDLGVTGNISVGLMTINGLDTSGNASINTIGDLYLQNNGTGGINLLAGKVTIDTVGNVTTKGTITAKNINTDKINITTSTAASQSGVLSTSAGTVTLSAGSTTVDVDTSALTAKSLVFTTPDNPIILGTKKVSGTIFRITTTVPQAQDVKINWWIVN